MNVDWEISISKTLKQLRQDIETTLDVRNHSTSEIIQAKRRIIHTTRRFEPELTMIVAESVSTLAQTRIGSLLANQERFLDQFPGKERR